MKYHIPYLLLLLIPIMVAGQHKQPATHRATSQSKQKTVKQQVTTITTVNYAYYDASRGGYIFMEDGKQSFLPALPVLPDNLPPRTTLPLTRKLELDLYPQMHYPNVQTVHPDKNSN